MEYLQFGAHFTQLSTALFSLDREELYKAIELLRAARDRHSNVWIVGNGGSAATAAHFANDLAKMCRIRAFSIPSMISTVTAMGNDDGWDEMFAHTIDVYLEPDDVVVAISCSGRSKNVAQAARNIRNLIVLTGDEYSDNILLRLPAQAVFTVPNVDILVQEDVHLAICHAIAKILRMD
jgi:D-sedoheptulose 7-phosphate isomerase